jgi:NAD-dependent SIR2 family protein deacetylase
MTGFFMHAQDISGNDGAVESLAALRDRHGPLFVLTGAGCSTDSGIPDYRDAVGKWKHSQPVLYQDFVGKEAARRRYWARSMVGWPRFARAYPNCAHHALARLEHAGHVHQVVTQNVDGLHQRAGSRRVIDLHGRLDTVQCLQCGIRIARAGFQAALEAANPRCGSERAVVAPDGDAHLEDQHAAALQVPACAACGGMLKPAVVFFGEAVPAARVQRAMERLREAGTLLVVGSSLMVFSGYRFVRAAVRAGKPVVAINHGHTRADGELTLKIERPCGPTLQALTDRLGYPAGRCR